MIPLLMLAAIGWVMEGATPGFPKVGAKGKPIMGSWGASGKGGTMKGLGVPEFDPEGAAIADEAG